MSKTYMQHIKEDLFQYLVRIEIVPNTQRELRYSFSINLTNIDTKYFILLSRRLKCWRRTTKDTFTWNTDSVVLRDMFNKPRLLADKGKEQVEDIPTYFGTKEQIKFNQEYECNFENKGKQMKSNKFSINYKINISVNEKVFLLTDPINKDDALEVVLELNNRMNYLRGQFDDLNVINGNSDEATDNINVNKISEVLTDEINEIKEVIEYINDNIDES